MVDDDLVCPECQINLQREPQAYRCAPCGAVYPVVDGIPRFVPPLKGTVELTRRSFDLQWRKSKERGEYNQFDPQYREKLVRYLLDDVMLPASYFWGIHALDAGCGVGRWTYAMVRLGARVTAIDYNDEAVTMTRDYFKDEPSVRVIQADLMRLPFRPASFDFILAWGVLHHTRDTRRAFDSLVPLVVPRGTFFVMVYERYNLPKLWFTDLVRRLAVRMDRERLYRVSEVLAWLCRYRVIRYSLKPLIDVGYSAEGNYDSFAKALNYHHTAEEVLSWFCEAGFRDITLNASRQFRNPLFRLLQGRWGGTVRMRGTRVPDPRGVPCNLRLVTGGIRRHT